VTVECIAITKSNKKSSATTEIEITAGKVETATNKMKELNTAGSSEDAVEIFGDLADKLTELSTSDKDQIKKSLFKYI
jgi:hypothetical protein